MQLQRWRASVVDHLLNNFKSKCRNVSNNLMYLFHITLVTVVEIDCNRLVPRSQVEAQRCIILSASYKMLNFIMRSQSKSLYCTVERFQCAEALPFLETQHHNELPCWIYFSKHLSLLPRGSIAGTWSTTVINRGINESRPDSVLPGYFPISMHFWLGW